MTTCRVEEMKRICACTYEPCPRKGRCCECVEYHRNNGEIPGCFFPPDAEKTCDRSIRRFVETFRSKA
ncbi:MAG TPA: DUF6485 family protein [bacterium]|nr:DUF6485 family protein [bacterium]